MEHLIDRIRDTLQHAQSCLTSCHQPSLAVAIMPLRLQTGCATEGKPDAIPILQPIPLTILH